jgi:hypothetical protein
VTATEIVATELTSDRCLRLVVKLAVREDDEDGEDDLVRSGATSWR